MKKSDVTWVKSSYSNGQGGECIEWARTGPASIGDCLVRDSKNPAGPILTFGPEAWQAFVVAAAEGAFGEV